MFLCEATEAVIARAVEHRIPGKRKKLWAQITAEAAKNDYCDGHLIDLLLEIVRDVVKGLDEKALLTLYRDTETGMMDQAKDDELILGCMDVEMELLKAVTDTAWDEARPRKKGKKYDMRRDDPDHDPYDPW